MPLDHYVTLGRSGLKVSPMCLGTLTFGEEGGYGAPPDVSKTLLDHYLDRGGNFIDTANYYSFGHAEKIIGDHLGQYPERRQRAVIATKFSTNCAPGDPNAGGANRKSIIKACEDSLRRLQTDYIDLYWQHFEDPFTPVDETMQALNDLVRSGKVRYIGFSDSPAWRVAQAQVTASFRGWAPLIALQLEYSLLERSMEAELVPAAKELGLGITPFALLAEGLLTGKYQQAVDRNDVRGEMVSYRRSDRAAKVVQVVTDIARARETTSSRVALAWVLAQPQISSGIVGAKTTVQLEENLSALETRLTEDEISQLNSVSIPRENFSARTTRNMLPISYPDFTINGQFIPKNRFSLSAGKKMQ